jgi:dipeptidyl aminopeptidase/acylaminoacyl peptidase
MLALLLITGVLAQSALAPHIPAIDDIHAIKGTGRIAATANGKLIAIEAEEGILILSTDYPFTRVKSLKGSQPQWSHDGDMLAFYADIDGKSQIEVWYRKLDSIEQITHLSEGISQNPLYWAPGSNARSLAWSPDSKSISFCSRRMPGYELLGQQLDSPKIRLFTTGVSYSNEMDGVFRTDFDDVISGDFKVNLERTHAVQKRPELGLNKLFVVDLKAKNLRQFTQSDQHFVPSWSPDSRKVATVVELDGVVEFPGPEPLHTALAVFNVQTGEEQRIATPRFLNGPPQWSADGSEIAMISQQGVLRFPRIEVYSFRRHSWESVTAPKGMAVEDVKWDNNGHSLLIKTADRFVSSLWLIDPTTNRFAQIDTNDLILSDYFDEDLNGDLFLGASSATFVDRVFKRSFGNTGPMQQLYDPNPNLFQLQLGQQKRLTWTNKAGEEVDGILIFPPNYQASRRYPVLIDLYPLAARNGLRLGGNGLLGQIEAARGYVVFQPALRTPLTPSYYSRDENYNEKARGAKGIPIMVDDFTSAVKYLIQQGIADPDRIGLYGHSNGAYVANFLITETKIAKCAVVWSGASNLTYMEYFLPDFVHEITSGDIYTDLDEFVMMSPIFRMNRVHIPLLMVVGDRDWDTFLPQMLMQFNALKHLGKDVTMVRYADEGHSFDKPEDIKDLFDRVCSFFDQHLRPEQIVH